jgi:hypothetical protein
MRHPYALRNSMINRAKRVVLYKELDMDIMDENGKLLSSIAT